MSIVFRRNEKRRTTKQMCAFEPRTRLFCFEPLFFLFSIDHQKTICFKQTRTTNRLMKTIDIRINERTKDSSKIDLFSLVFHDVFNR